MSARRIGSTILTFFTTSSHRISVFTPRIQVFVYPGFILDQVTRWCGMAAIFLFLSVNRSLVCQRYFPGAACARQTLIKEILLATKYSRTGNWYILFQRCMLQIWVSKPATHGTRVAQIVAAWLQENGERVQKWRGNGERFTLYIPSFSLYFFPLYPFPLSNIDTFCRKLLNAALLSRMSQKT